jgi:hypothetical protein
MNTQPDEPAMHVGSRADLLAAVPFLLGYHPGDAAVILAVADKAVLAVMAAPLPADPATMAAAFRDALTHRPDVRTAIVIGYGPHTMTAPLQRLADQLTGTGLDLAEVIRVQEGRLYCLLCDQCTPADGLPVDPTGTAVAAAAVFAGRVAFPDRDAMRHLVQSTVTDPHAWTAALNAAADELRRHGLNSDFARQIVDHALDAAQRGARVGDDDAARLMLVLQHPQILDHAWRSCDSQVWQLELWLDLTRRCEPTLAAPAATLAAWCAWRRGNSALARMATDRALDADPSYRIALLLDDVLARGLPPGDPCPPSADAAGDECPMGESR